MGRCMYSILYFHTGFKPAVNWNSGRACAHVSLPTRHLKKGWGTSVGIESNERVIVEGGIMRLNDLQGSSYLIVEYLILE